MCRMAVSIFREAKGYSLNESLPLYPIALSVRSSEYGEPSAAAAR